MEAAYNTAPVALQVCFREFENIVLEHGIEPIIFRILIGSTGPLGEEKRRIEIQCHPFLYSEKLVCEILERLLFKYGRDLIVIHRKRYDKLPERLILEIPQTWVDYPKVFLAKFGYIKGGNHS